MSASIDYGISDSSFDCRSKSDDAVSAKRSSKESQKTLAMKAELKKLLSRPVIATGAYKTYVTSGSRDIVSDLLKSDRTCYDCPFA